MIEFVLERLVVYGGKFSKLNLIKKVFIRNINDLFYFSVKKYPIVVCPSSINRSDKENLANVITKIGGKITKEWSEECTHLCMNTISVTEKVS